MLSKKTQKNITPIAKSLILICTLNNNHNNIVLEFFIRSSPLEKHYEKI